VRKGKRGGVVGLVFLGGWVLERGEGPGGEGELPGWMEVGEAVSLLCLKLVVWVWFCCTSSFSAFVMLYSSRSAYSLSQPPIPIPSPFPLPTRFLPFHSFHSFH